MAAEAGETISPARSTDLPGGEGLPTPAGSYHGHPRQDTTENSGDRRPG